jgi:3-hydroxy-9,10-secoandrosta-1,3,5(10)-triene-9,17-dione monooxygenase reductase component
MTGARAIDHVSFRRALSLFATGVTVITVQRGEIMHGMTANAFSALSLDPPLVLFCVGTQARMAGLLEGAEGFAVSILSADQESVSGHFAGPRGHPAQPGPEDVERLLQGPVAPLIPGALVSLSCSLETLHEGGDHWIVIGKVLEIHQPEGGNPRPPLLFYRSRYATLVEQRRRPEERISWTNDAIRIYHDEWSVDAGEKLEEEYVRALLW